MNKISVIMPAKNAEFTITDSVASVISQPELGELIIVDDGSTDKTRDVLDKITDGRVHVIQGPRNGIARALNAGLSQARFTYIARCDADDLYSVGRFARQSAWLHAHPDFVGVSGGFITIDKSGKQLAVLASEGEAREVTDVLRGGNVMTHLCTWLMRRDALITLGGARPWFQTAEDVDLQFRLAEIGRVWHDPQPTYLYRLHQNSITHTRQPDRLKFFDDMAVDFNHQRIACGQDALDAGAAPTVPDFSDGTKLGHDALRRQVSGHLTAQAWRDFHAGRRLDGIAGLFRALRCRPADPSCWRGLAVMTLRVVQRKR